MATKRKSSAVWDHFETTNDPKRAKCNYCSKVLAISSSSIGSLSRHLKSIHPTVSLSISRLEPLITTSDEQIASAESHEVSNSTSTPSADVLVTSLARRSKQVVTSTMTMKDYVVVKKPLPQNRVHELDEQLLKMIAKGYHTLRMVEEKEFRKLVEMLNPSYTLPTRKTLSESLLPKYFKKVEDAVKTELKNATDICITTDGWRSRTNDDYIAITAHFIHPETQKLNAMMIGCINFNDSHTSVKISNFLQEKFCEWNIENKITAVVSDNAANILAAVRIGGWQSISCFAHSINIAVQHSIVHISETVGKVKHVIEYFHRSQPGARKLKEIQEQMNISPLKLKQDISTRWNSTYDMLNRLLRMKDPVIASIAIMRPDLTLSQEDWEVVEQAIAILSIFYEVTNEVSGEEYVSASKYIVLCKLIFRQIGTYSTEAVQIGSIQALVTSLLMELKRRFGAIEENVLLREATILDPRFKKNGFSDPRLFDAAVADLRLKISSIVMPNDGTTAVAESSTSTVSKTGSIWDKFDEEVFHQVLESPIAAGIVELDKYLGEPLLNRQLDPLQWWKERKAVYPHLHSYMLKRLNISATSVPCERVFSKAGLTLNERRTRLTTKKLSQLMFLSCN